MTYIQSTDYDFADVRASSDDDLYVTDSVPIGDGVSIPRFTALTLDADAGVYKPVTDTAGSDYTANRPLSGIGFHYGDNLEFTRDANRENSESVRRTVPNYYKIASVATMEIPDDPSSDYNVSSTAEWNEGVCTVKLIFNGQADMYDFAGFAVTLWSLDTVTYDTVNYVADTDYTVACTVTKADGVTTAAYTITAIAASSLATAIAAETEINFNLRLKQKNITYTAGVDYDITYSTAKGSGANANKTYNVATVNFLPGGRLYNSCGLYTISYNDHTVSGAPSAIAIHSTAANAARLAAVYTAGKFKAALVPNLVPTVVPNMEFV